MCYVCEEPKKKKKKKKKKTKNKPLTFVVVVLRDTNIECCIPDSSYKRIAFCSLFVNNVCYSRKCNSVANC